MNGVTVLQAKRQRAMKIATRAGARFPLKMPRRARTIAQAALL
jgi:hypothetical protein